MALSGRILVKVIAKKFYLVGFQITWPLFKQCMQLSDEKILYFSSFRVYENFPKQKHTINKLTCLSCSGNNFTARVLYSKNKNEIKDIVPQTGTNFGICNYSRIVILYDTKNTLFGVKTVTYMFYL